MVMLSSPTAALVPEVAAPYDRTRQPHVLKNMGKTLSDFSKIGLASGCQHEKGAWKPVKDGNYPSVPLLWALAG